MILVLIQRQSIQVHFPISKMLGLMCAKMNVKEQLEKVYQHMKAR